MTAKLREVDTRRIEGNGGSVVLYMPAKTSRENIAKTSSYEVHVLDCHGEHRHTLYADTRADALEAYWHPFACQDTPDLFARVPEPEPEPQSLRVDGQAPLSPDEVPA